MDTHLIAISRSQLLYRPYSALEESTALNMHTHSLESFTSFALAKCFILTARKWLPSRHLYSQLERKWCAVFEGTAFPSSLEIHHKIGIKKMLSNCLHVALL